MTAYALTLIGTAGSTPLQSVHIERICQRLSITGETDWLCEGEACDIFIDSAHSASKIAADAVDALSGTMIDAVCTPVLGRRKKLLVSDMDSTVINQECIDELGEAYGVGAQIKQITTAVISGDIGFADALRQRMALMKGMEQGLLEDVYENKITLQPGARTFVRTMAHHGAYCVLVSGGFSFFTSRIAQRIGFHDHHGNELVFADGKLTGDVLEPILGRTAKLDTLTGVCAEKGLDLADVLAVGDGANDIKMIQAAGLGVAFHGPDIVKEQANACINHGDLTALLYIQGFHKSEFIDS